MKITVDLAANTAQFESEFKRAERTLKDRMGSIEASAKKAGAAIGTAIAGGLTIATAALVSWTRETINSAQQIDRLSKLSGTSATEFQRQAYAARTAGVEADKLADIYKDVQDKVGDFLQTGGGALADFFENIAPQVGVTADQFRKLSGPQALQLYVSSLQKANLSQSDMVFYMEAIASDATALLPLLRDNGAEMSRLSDEASRLGGVMSDETIASVQNLRNTTLQLEQQWTAFKTEIVVGAIPAIQELSQELSSPGFKDGFAAIVQGAVSATTAVAGLVSEIGNVTNFVAEEAAARVGGPNLGDTVRIEDAIQRQRDLIDRLDYTSLSTVFGGQNPGMEEAVAELARLEEMLRLSTEAAEANAIAEQARRQSQSESNVTTEEAVTANQNLGRTFQELEAARDAEAKAAKAAEDAARRAARAIQEATRAQAQTQARAVGATAQLNQLLRQQAATLGGPAAQAAAQYADTLDYIAQLEAEILAIGPPTLENQQALNDARKMAAEQMEAMGEEAQWAQSIFDEFGQTRLEGLISEIERVGEALKEALTPDQRKAMLAYMNELQAAAGEYRQQGLETMVGATQQVLGSIQSLSKKGSSAYKALEVASQALNVVLAIGAVLNQGKGDPYTAFARMAAMAVAVAGLVGSIGANFGGSNGFTDTAAERQATQGRGTVLGDAEAQSQSIANATEITADATSELVGINRGMLNALQALQGGLDRAGGMLARGVGQAPFTEIGGSFSFADNFLGGALSFAPLDPLNLLGGSSRITDQGLMIGGGGLGDVGVRAFQEQQYRRWRFGSRRTREETVPVAEEFADQFQLIIDSIADTVRRGAEALGLLPAEVEAALEAFRLEEIRISLKDLSAEEQQAELLAVFSQIFDNLAGDVVPFIEQFQRVGEGLGETLVRVATGVQVTQEAMLRLGFAIDEVDPERFAQISEGLIDAVGGIEAFIDGMKTFSQSFAPESHQLAIAQDELTRAFDQAGLVLPATREGMWALMQSLDATTEAGQMQIATLLRLAGVADTYYGLLERNVDNELQERIDHLENLMDAQREYYDFAEGIAQQFAQTFGSTLNVSLINIERQYRENVRTAGELARAAGMAGAAERDLARIELIAARQRAEAIRLTEESARGLAGDLGLTELSQLESQIAAFEAASGGIQSAVGGVADAFDAAAQRARETMDLLIGDNSPLRDREKLDLALQGLRAGTVSADQVLTIGRRLFASGQDYRQLFDQVLAINAGRPLGTAGPVDVGGGTPAVPRELQELLTRRDQILADQAAQQARTNALQLVEQIGELASVQALSFEEVAATLGIDLRGLADILQVDSDTLSLMLQRQADEAAEQREAVLEIPDQLQTALEPTRLELAALRLQVDTLIEATQAVAQNTGRTAGAAESQAETTANRDLVDTSVAPRSSRIGIGTSGTGGRGDIGFVPAQL